MTNSRRRFLWTAFASLVVIAGTAIAINFAKGYRFSRDSIVAGNGLLVVNSDPKGARVLVNDRFLTATDDTLYLDPGEYQVEIQKDGYFPWKKDVVVEQEVVTQANALLFPTAPGLAPITLSGASQPAPSPDGQKLAYYTASSSAQTKNGYYVLELVDNPLAFQRGPRQVSRSSDLFPPEETQMIWSPDSTQILLVSPRKAVLIDPSRLNEVDEQTDISFQLSTIFSQWEEEMYQRDRERLVKFPLEIQRVATASAVNVYFSPDEKRLMYTATEEFNLPANLLPAKPGSNNQPESRQTKIGNIYIYDRDEDKQFWLGEDTQYLSWTQQGGELPSMQLPINSEANDQTNNAQLNQPSQPESDQAEESATAFNPQKQLLSSDLFRSQPLNLKASPSAFTRLQRDNIDKTILNFRTYHSPLYTHRYQWFPNSWHILYHDDTSLTLREYDGTNIVRVFSGPFDTGFVYPWPNGSRLIIRTNLNQGNDVPINLYTINLK